MVDTLKRTQADGLFLGGAFRAGRGSSLALVDPSTGDAFATVSLGNARDLDDAVASARAAADAWGRSAPLDRGRLLRRVSDIILRRSEELAELVVRDAGLPLGLARRDVETAARYFEFYAGVPDKLLGESIPVGDEAVDFTLREPWGVCGIMLPFNFPLQLTARDLAPALATGNVVVLKPPEQAPLAALTLASICSEAGAPDGVVTAVTGLGADVGDALVRHKDVDHITFTGSLATARRVLAAAAQNVRPTTIELGGKSPHVVFADADANRVVASILNTTFKTAGQACSAGTRVLVERVVHDDFAAALADGVRSLRVAAANTDPDVGPLISSQQRDTVLDAIAAAAAGGAHVTANAMPAAPSGGFFVAPTILDNVDPLSAAAQEEIFGPVVSVIAFDDEADAIALANDTDSGLVAGIWTHDIGRAMRVARRIRAGQVFVNTYGVGGGVELPFGGYKRSGFGRVKGIAGALEYTQIKNICIYSE